MTLSYITPTRWLPSRREWLLCGEQSLLAQTLNDIEWIIVSDSPSPDWLKGVVPTRMVFDESLLSVARKMNAGIRVATGDYIAFMDDDNLKLPPFGEQMVQFVATNGLDGAYCFAGTINQCGETIGDHKVSAATYEAGWRGGFWFNEELLVKRSLIESIGGFDEALEAGEDYDLAFALMKHGTLDVYPTALVKIRQNHGDIASADSYFTGGRTQFALHRILEKNGRLNPNCPGCGVWLVEKPFSETTVKWPTGSPSWVRICGGCPA